MPLVLAGWPDVTAAQAGRVLRLLRGEDLKTVSQALGVTAVTLSSWRGAFLAAGEASLAMPAHGRRGA